MHRFAHMLACLAMAFCSFLIALSFAAPAYADDQTIHCKYDSSSRTLFLGGSPFEGSSPVEVGSLEMYGLGLDGVDYASDISVVDFVNELVPDEGVSVAGMFDGCSVLTAVIHPENLKTGNVESMSYMFRGCSALAMPDLSSWDVSHVTEMNSMFSECTSLVEADLSDWSPAALVNAEYMFYGCSNLESLDVSGWSVPNLDLLTQFACGCSSLEELDLHTWQTGYVRGMGSLVASCTSLRSINLSGFVCGGTFLDAQWMFDNCDSLEVGDFSDMTMPNTDVAGEISLHADWDRVDCSGWNVTGSDTASGAFASGAWHADLLDVTDWNLPYATNMSGWFAGADIDDFRMSGWTVSAVEDTSYMFSYFENGRPIDLSGWDMSHLSNASEMFAGCSVPFLDISGWTLTSISSSGSVGDSSRIPQVNASGWTLGAGVDVGSVGSLIGGFTGTVNADRWDLSAVTTTSSMFQSLQCEELSLDNWDVHAVTDMSRMFSGNNLANLKTLSIEGWDVSNVEDMSAMFGASLTTVESLAITGWNISKVAEPSYGVFSDGFNELTYVDVGNWTFGGNGTLKVVASQFLKSPKLEMLDLSTWNVSAITDMTELFDNSEESCCKGLNLANWDVSHVTSMARMFASTTDLRRLDLTGWNTSSVTDMSGMFNWCASMQTIGVEDFDVSHVTNMGYMFCNSFLKEVDLSSWDVSAVVDMSSMFARCPLLRTLDLSGWHPRALESASRMFADDTRLATIYASKATDWSLDCPDPEMNAYEMFDGSTSLAGGSGTAYPSIATDAMTSARVDGYDGRPGYFTARIPKVPVSFSHTIEAPRKAMGFPGVSYTTSIVGRSAQTVPLTAEQQASGYREVPAGLVPRAVTFAPDTEADGWTGTDNIATSTKQVDLTWLFGDATANFPIAGIYLFDVGEISSDTSGKWLNDDSGYVLGIAVGNAEDGGREYLAAYIWDDAACTEKTDAIAFSSRYIETAPLVIEERTEGAFGNRQQEFPVEVTFYLPEWVPADAAVGDYVTGPAIDGGFFTEPDGRKSASFAALLADGDSVSATVPVGTLYKVDEKTASFDGIDYDVAIGWTVSRPFMEPAPLPTTDTFATSALADFKAVGDYLRSGNADADYIAAAESLVGQTLDVTLATGESVPCVLVDVSTDRGLTFESMQVIGDDKPINGWYSNYGGWSGSDLRQSMNSPEAFVAKGPSMEVEDPTLYAMYFEGTELDSLVHPVTNSSYDFADGNARDDHIDISVGDRYWLPALNNYLGPGWKIPDEPLLSYTDGDDVAQFDYYAGLDYDEETGWGSVFDDSEQPEGWCRTPYPSFDAWYEDETGELIVSPKDNYGWIVVPPNGVFRWVEADTPHPVVPCFCL